MATISVEDEGAIVTCNVIKIGLNLTLNWSSKSKKRISSKQDTTIHVQNSDLR